jgi:hypothetical protein
LADFDLAYAIDGDVSGALAATSSFKDGLKSAESGQREAANAATDLAAKTGIAAGAMEGAGRAAIAEGAALDTVGTKSEKARDASAKLDIAQTRLALATVKLTDAQNKAAAAADLDADAQAKAANVVQAAELRVLTARETVIVAQKRYNAASKDTIETSAKQGFAIRNIGQQFGDFGQQALAGAGVMRSFAQQAGQLGFALSELESGPFAKLGKFLVGPWGIAFTIGLQAVAAFSGKLFEAGTAADKEAEALKTVEGAVDALDKATGRLNKTKAQQIEIGERATTQLLKEALAQREVLKARQGYIDSARGNAGRFGQEDVSGIASIINQRQTSSNDAEIKRLQDSLGGVGFSAAVDKATDATNKSSAANRVYEATLVRIQAAYKRSEAGAKTEADRARNVALATNLIVKAQEKRDAVTKAGTAGVSAAIEADSSYAAASTAVAKAAAHVGQVRAQNAKDLASHNITQAEATNRLEAAKGALESARAAQKSHNAEVQQGKKDQTAANAALRDLETTLDRITAKYASASAGGKGFAKDLGDIARLAAGGKIGLGQNVTLTQGAFEAEAEATRKEQNRYFNDAAGKTPDQQLDGLLDDAQKLFEQSGEKFRNDALRAGKEFADAVGVVSGALQRALGGKAGAIAGTLGGVIQGQFDPETRQARRAESAKLSDALGKISKGIGISDEGAAKIGKYGGKAIEGAAAGALTNSVFAPIAKGLGLKSSQTGAQIGGALGAASGIPGGDIIGSIVGSVAGGLLKKTKSGGATIGDTSSDATISGSSKSLGKTAGGLAGSVQSGLEAIAKQLGGTAGSFGSITIGQRGDDYRVNVGGTSLKKKKGATDFNDDADAAVAFAIKTAIARGAVQGLDIAVQRALTSSDDIDKALEEALNVQKLQSLIGGVGNDLDRVFKTFDANAKAQVDLARKYGLDAIKAEKVLGEQRTKLINDTIRSAVGSLQDLQDELGSGDLFEGSAVDKRKTILDKIGALRPDAEKGVDGAADQLAGLYRQLLSFRDTFGTASEEYTSDRGTVATGAAAVIKAEQDRVNAAAKLQTDTLAAAQQQVALANENNDLMIVQNELLRKLLNSAANNNSSGLGITPAATARQVNLAL